MKVDLCLQVFHPLLLLLLDMDGTWGWQQVSSSSVRVMAGAACRRTGMGWLTLWRELNRMIPSEAWVGDGLAEV